MTVEDAFAQCGEWTRDLIDAKKKIKELEGKLEAIKKEIPPDISSIYYGVSYSDFANKIRSVIDGD